MTDSGSRRGAANLAPILMILSFVAMIAFLVWLGATSEGTESVAMLEEDTAGEMDDDAGAIEVQEGDLVTNPAAYEGQRVRISSEVTSPVGSRAFFLDLPQSPFLVAMGEALLEQRGGTMPSGEITVTGTLHEMTDSIIDAWREEGLIDEGDVPVVEFATHFIEADRIRSGGDEEEGEPEVEEGG